MDTDAHSTLVNIEDDSPVNDSNVVASVDVSGDNAMQDVRFPDFDISDYVNFDDMVNGMGPINLDDFEKFFE